MQHFNQGRKSLALSVIVIAILLFAGIPAVSAYTATLVTPTDVNTVHPGDTVTIRIDGLTNGNTFWTQLISSDIDPGATAVTFSDFNLPFGFTGGSTLTTLTTTGIGPGPTTITVIDPFGTTRTGTNTGSPNTITSTRPITAGMYKTSISGIPSGALVGINYRVGGTSVTGAVSPATLTFKVEGIESGNLRIIVNDGAVDRLDKTLKITPASSPSGGNIFNVGGDGGGVLGPTAPAAPPAAPSGPHQVTMLIAQEGQTLATYSVSTPTDATVDATVTVDQGTTITDPQGNFVDTVSIEPASPADVPSMTGGGSFAVGGAAVNCGPEGATFSEPASLTFSLTQEQWDLAMAQAGGNPALIEVQYYDKATQTWVGVPTTVNLLTHEVTALVDHFSVFALVVIRAPAAAVAAAAPAAEAPPVLTQEPTTLMAKPPVTTVKPTPAPFVSVPAMIGVLVVAGLAYTLGRKK